MARLHEVSGQLPDDLFRSEDDAAGQGARSASSADDAALEVAVLTSALTARRSDDVAASPRGTGRGLWLLGLVAVALSLVIGLAAGGLVRSLRSTPSIPASPSPTPAPTQSPVALPWAGQTAPLLASGVRATCTAPDALDADGNLVTYDVAQVLDDRPETAWRCNGEGTEQRLTFTFPAGSVLVGVGLVNGYAKARGTTSLYDQFRRISSVTWRLPDGSWFVQNLNDNDPGLQQLMVPPTLVEGQVTMTITASSAPGQPDDPTRNAVLVSQVSFLTTA